MMTFITNVLLHSVLFLILSYGKVEAVLNTQKKDCMASSEDSPTDGSIVDQELKAIEENWISEQEELKRKLIETDTEEWEISRTIGADGVSRVAGVDISFIKDDKINACASVVVLSLPDLKIIYSKCSMIKLTAPYIAGFLAFREVPHLIQLVNEIPARLKPQIILVDGNGILHYRGFGLACHLGVLLNIPTVGVAKNFLEVDGLNREIVLQTFKSSCSKKHDRVDLVGDSGKIHGKAYQSTDTAGKHPIYVSIGHKISLETSAWLLEKCCAYKIPEPIRKADHASRDYLRTHDNFSKGTADEIELISKMEKLSVKKD